MDKINKCENCKHFYHKPNIIGGITECKLDVKVLNTFMENIACGKFELDPQKEIPDNIFATRIFESINEINKSYNTQPH